MTLEQPLEDTSHHEVLPPRRPRSIRGYVALAIACVAIISLLGLVSAKQHAYKACVASRMDDNTLDYYRIRRIPPSLNAATRSCARHWPDWLLW